MEDFNSSVDNLKRELVKEKIYLKKATPWNNGIKI